ncbi:ADP-ribosylglycohydrolase family protein [Bombilactobacillus thymidiniphilus]|uniref:ADP-ribosylglycohydrolase family protein n=1 Tax=Bombilactobacillus thymidiniphilus TaxID=2923363 RepID=A0ABY4PFC4_9LACO|nr:ADP-ribosylglycohydrolase family protein [Bombilactobacillus thymidiniphilus]UQS84241.1 ADP-ribosylglycohydrolase family protein [Bombilactobacillus thymidiniphilus]
MRKLDNILGTLYGQAIGDAMGMPTELWSQEQIAQAFPQGITNFVAGPATNDIARYFDRGEYTDDTNQALVILDSLIQTEWQPQTTNLVQHLLQWAQQVNAWDNNVLGPSSKAALTLAKAGKKTAAVTAQAVTNGAAMRIAPIGALFEPAELDQLVDLVVAVTQVTHSSDVAYSGACLIAGAVTAAQAGYAWDELVKYALKASDLGFLQGCPTWAAKIHNRVDMAIALARQYSGQPQDFRRAIYDTIGTGTMLSESVPAALAIAYYFRDVEQCALFCANLGGDTDTIGAMATAICGAAQGAKRIKPAWRQLINQQNPQHDLSYLAQQMMQYTSYR